MNFTNGFYDLPNDKLATVVTALEMFEEPAQQPCEIKPDWTLRFDSNPDAEQYREIYRRIGEEWLWFSRAIMPLEELDAIISQPKVEIRLLEIDGKAEGLLELDYRIKGECELAFLGVTNKLLGQGAGKWMMNSAVKLAWSSEIKRFWVHTCTLDHPCALPFYIKTGFIPYDRQLEIADDPRLMGLFSPDLAAHFPVLNPPEQ